MSNEFIDDTKAAKFMGLKPQTLRNWRHLCKGPAYRKVGRAVRYSIEDLIDYMEKQRIDPEK